MLYCCIARLQPVAGLIYSVLLFTTDAHTAVWLSKAVIDLPNQTQTGLELSGLEQSISWICNPFHETVQTILRAVYYGLLQQSKMASSTEMEV